LPLTTPAPAPASAPPMQINIVNDNTNKNTITDAANPWAQHADPASGKPYWHNSQTGETTWDNPVNPIPHQPDLGQSTGSEPAIPTSSPAASSMDIFVHMLNGKTITVASVQGSMTVIEVKALIEVPCLFRLGNALTSLAVCVGQAQEGIPPAQQRLVFSGKELEDNVSLQDYQISQAAHFDPEPSLCSHIAVMSQESNLHLVKKAATEPPPSDPEALPESEVAAEPEAPSEPEEPPVDAVPVAVSADALPVAVSAEAAGPAASEVGNPCTAGCGYVVPDGAKFCPACGAPQKTKKFCGNCGASLPAEAKFCNQCGTPQA
jgi:RNA polymerase subunit RPABC4/transcription elongation factor Spt4